MPPDEFIMEFREEALLLWAMFEEHMAEAYKNYEPRLGAQIVFLATMLDAAIGMEPLEKLTTFCKVFLAMTTQRE
jgi:hypothetical protein